VKSLPLSTNWQVKQRSAAQSLADDFAASDGWIPASAPGTVHQDLLAAGLIPDPFVGLNELEVRGVGDAEWLYRCAFDLSPDSLTADEIVLCFDGLDTFVTVWLNDEQILVSDNMFIPYRLPVKNRLKPGRNELRLRFEAAMARGQERERQHGAMAIWGDSDTSRVYVRKAQYHYGWDWGPTLMTAGPWRAVRLETYAARIADLHCPVEVAANLQSATLPVKVTLENGQAQSGLEVQLKVYGPNNQWVSETTLPATNAEVTHTFEINSPALWWPQGYGAQPRYRLEVILKRADEILDQRELRLGLRRLRLVQEPLTDEPGQTFFFEVNNTPIFCGGANWIPADSFLPRVTPERYRALLQLAVEANLVMLRVWGGGIYEEDVFYDLCDELGLLVWQDFMFACGLYPALDWFQPSVRAEAEAAVRRLRHHACIALWCGNNEDYQLAHSVGAYDPAFEGDFASTRFPGRALYERVLPEVCAALDPTRTYWRGSPYGGPDANEQTLGDRHTWDIWHRQMSSYQDYPKFAGRFVSEFGMQAFPALSTVEAFAGPDERYPASRTMDHHNKALDGPMRIAKYLTENVRIPEDLESFIYVTQLIQAEALASAYRGWRRRWGGPGRYAVSGALVWQLEDCWPVTSWAIVDYALRAKPAYFVVRREMAPVSVGLARSAEGVEVWAVNGTLTAREVELDLRAWTFSGEQVAGREARRKATLLPNQATELGGFTVKAHGPVVVSARLLDPGGTVLARAALWPEPFKYFKFPDPEIEVKELTGDQLRLRVKRPAKGVLLSTKNDVAWSDNMLDLMPEDEQIVVASGLGGAKAQVRWLS